MCVYFTFCCFSVNYQKNWKCAAVLKPDGGQHQQEQSTLQIATGNVSGNNAKYYKRGTISNPNQVPWH